MDAVEQAKSGHPGMPMGMADVATVLFTQFLRFDSQAADWPDRDRFVLSAGHDSMLLYALLHLTGYADMTIDELKRFRQLGSRTAEGSVEPTRSQNMTVSCRHSATGAGDARSFGAAALFCIATIAASNLRRLASTTPRSFRSSAVSPVSAS